MDALSPEALADRIDRGERVTLLDTRNRTETDEWRIDGPTVDRVEVPYMKFVAARARSTSDPADLLPDDLAEPVVVVCARGEASDEVAAMLRESGVDAVNLAEGMHGWARVYRATELDAGKATVVQYRRPSSGCLAYLVVAGDEALVVDPLRAFADRYAADARDRGADLVAAVDTHVHADHVSGLRDVAATRYMSERAVARGVTYEVETLADGDAIGLGDTEIAVLATPGHTTGMVSLRVGDVLLCGDTLFVDGVPRPDLESGDDAAEHARDLHRTLTERLAPLPDDTVVAPGHYGEGAERAPDGTYTAPLGDLRERLWPFGTDRESFVARVLEGLGPRPANDERIVAVNLGREAAADDEAFELELGPNNCAASAD
ncbi:MBL fold metallo-hydrolase [Halosegnis marinus]|uniref:MBL fold metallo-hydrolase n=1 Tax=Halosegnis marinus TaxID=3034023 RepID=A0ABD5ZNI9_9EURY|nr:MBL fold metallo-hydrolase [Halosegnis sp. DT85]